MKPLFRVVPSLPMGAAPAAADTETSTEAVWRELRSARPLYDGVVFSGPEPTSRPDLLTLLDGARRLGFRHRQIDTDAVRLAPRSAARIADAGANLVLVELAGADPARHDRVRGRPGSFVRALRGLRALLSVASARPGLHVAARVTLPPETDAAVEAARTAFQTLPTLGLRDLFFALAGPAADIAPPERLVAALETTAREAPASLRTIGLGAAHLLRGSERTRPPFALARDGDPFAFRASAGDGPRVLLIHTPRHRAPEDRTVFAPLGLARLRAHLRRHGYEADIVDLDARAFADPAAAGPLTDGRLTDGRLTDGQLTDGRLAAPAQEGGGDEAVAAGAALEEALEGTLSACFERLLADIDLDAYDVVGVDVVDPFRTFQVDVALALGRWLGRVRPTATRVVGGDSLELAKLVRRAGAIPDAFQLAFDGQGELGLLGLLNRAEFRDRPASALHNVVGGDVNLGDREAGDNIYHHPFVEVRRKRLPAPSFGDAELPLYTRGPSPELARFLVERGVGSELPPLATLPFQMVTGCNAQCIFCNYPRHMDIVPPERAAQDLAAVADETGVRQFYLLDPTLNITPQFLARFADELIRLDRDLLWFDSARPIGLDAELALRLRAAGCVMLTFGVDGGSDPLLRAMNKGFTIDDVERSLAATAAAGIVNRFNLIVGFPAETERDVVDTIEFVRRNAENLHVLGCYNPFYLTEAVPLEERGVPIRRRGEQALLAGSWTETWDEIGGPTWPEKLATVEANLARILAEIGAAGVCPRDISEHDVLLLARAALPDATVRDYVRWLAALPEGRPRVVDLGWQS